MSRALIDEAGRRHRLAAPLATWESLRNPDRQGRDVPDFVRVQLKERRVSRGALQHECHGRLVPGDSEIDSGPQESLVAGTIFQVAQALESKPPANDAASVMRSWVLLMPAVTSAAGKGPASDRPRRRGRAPASPPDVRAPG